MLATVAGVTAAAGTGVNVKASVVVVDLVTVEINGDAGRVRGAWNTCTLRKHTPLTLYYCT